MQGGGGPCDGAHAAPRAAPSILGMRSPRPFYPAGGAGLGLGLVRCCVAAFFVAEAVHRLPVPWAWWCGTAVFLLAALMVLGAATGWAALGACGFHAALLIAAPQALGVLALAPAMALLLLGPGAYSIDGLRHGRRRLVWKHDR